MSDCGRDWGPTSRYDGEWAEDCEGCWRTIFEALTSRPGEKILPRPEFCQAAAFIAYMIDSLKTTILQLGELDDDEGQRIAEIFDEARQEAADGP